MFGGPEKVTKSLPQRHGAPALGQQIPVEINPRGATWGLKTPLSLVIATFQADASLWVLSSPYHSSVQ